MTQIQTEYFIKTCELGNIAQAADALFVSRSAVSRAISDLEREFQAELLTRSKNGVVPTRAGRMVLEMAKNMSSSYVGVVDQIRQLQEDALYRRVRIAITPTNGLQVYRGYIRKYALENPEKDLLITEACATDCLDLLNRAEVDVAFIPSGIVPDRQKKEFTETLPLYQNRIVCWMQKNSPLAKRTSLEIHDILDCPLGFLSAPMPMESALKSCFEAYGKEPLIKIRTTSRELLRQMVIDGKILAMMPDDLFEPSPEMVTIPMRFFRPSTNYLMWNRSIPPEGAVAHFISFMESLSII